MVSDKTPPPRAKRAAPRGEFGFELHGSKVFRAGQLEALWEKVKRFSRKREPSRRLASHSPFQKKRKTFIRNRQKVNSHSFALKRIFTCSGSV